jgi:adenine C2-methylase RlmN of 23S rRNA A2503 and tRNA A37
MGEGNMNLDVVIEQLEYFPNIFGGHLMFRRNLMPTNGLLEQLQQWN